LNPETNQALLNFQKQYNIEFVELSSFKDKFSRNFSKIDEDGKIGKQTWGAFFDMYSLELLHMMMCTEDELNELRGKIIFVKKSPSHPSPVIGCGENFPASGATTEEENAVDRRVEILFFDPGEEPLLECHPNKFNCIKTKCDLYPKDVHYKHIPVPAKKIEPAVEFTYKIKISFQGPTHIKHTQHYRCNYDLEEVPKKEVKANDEIKSAEYRIMVHDNHALKDSESDMLGSDGDKTSKTENYKNNNWIRDINPAIPLRIEVRKIKDGQEVEIDKDTLFLNFELSDPEEDLSPIDQGMNPPRPKELIEKFGKTFKRLPNDDSSKEDDNAPEIFDGLRTADKKVSPSSVLFGTTIPLIKVNEDVSRISIVPDKDSSSKPIGLSDITFIPRAVGGDNYKFIITVIDKGNKKLQLVDDSSNQVENITTGKFTVWRRVMIDLLVTTDNVDLSYIDWKLVNKSYTAAFMEVIEPKGSNIKKYNESEWKATVRDYFKNDVGSPKASVRNDDTKFDYANFFLPDFVSNFPADDPDDWCWTHGEALAKKFLKKAYSETGKKNPRTEDKNQDITPGLYMFLCKDLHDVSSALGMYMGDREFFMVTVGDATCTFTHEMGHAIFLRHSLIRFDDTNKITEDIRNKNWLDHDQNDAISCTMSYSNDFFGSDGKTKRAKNAVEWHFCAVCLLTLRFYDRIKISDDVAAQKLICEKLKPIQITDKSFNPIPGAAASIKKNASKDFKALAKEEGIINNDGIDFKKDLTSAREGRWVSDNPAIADFITFQKIIGGVKRTFSGRLKGQDAGTGKIKIHYEIGTILSEVVEVDITD
jgi:hypothetical protein